MKITTYAFNIHLYDLEYEHKNKTLSPANQHQTLIPIGEDFKKIELFSIEDNEGYFEGSICIEDSGNIIVDKHVQTGDLYMLWYDLYQATIMNEYIISYLDVDFEIYTFKKENNIVLTILEEKDKRTTYSLPLNEFNHAVKEGLIEFYNHLNHDYIRNDFDSPYYFKLKDIYTDIC
ncbi:hypothetical protein [Macrococcoides canis]|uniref:DUF402 domain-containing protein n=1 Tax=Macrococcoides canis TaxID=1855823 RepID=A0AAE7C0N8_9STAP|nr:hypothetical protein [Macrococcus canis]QIH79062.1 hypothetical protein GTN30_10435 [Macrococcus canis]QNR08595.1 hypothetical protein GL258_10225 [Macrococcus canis]